MYHGERFNGYSHLGGTLLAIAAATVLIVYGATKGDVWKIVSFSIYGTTLITLFGFSTLYHSTRGTTKRVFRKFDHSAIYLLIAGTYTPFTLGVLRGVWGWILFGLVWSMAVVGIVLKVFGGIRYNTVSTLVYVAMGWLVVIAADTVWTLVPMWGIVWLLAGGIAYTAGAVFFLAERIRYFHFVWHLFVIAGTACHIVAVLWYAA